MPTMDERLRLLRELEDARAELHAASDALGPRLELGHGAEGPVDLALWIRFDVAWDRHELAARAYAAETRLTA